MSFKSLVLASALATVLPGVATAVSMGCDDPGKRLSSPYSSVPGRDGSSYRRRELPEWLGKRRSQGFGPSFARPERPDRARDRRQHRSMPKRPELPEWVKARRETRPAIGSGHVAPSDTGRPSPFTPPARRSAAFERRIAPNRGVPGRFRPVGIHHWSHPAWIRPYGRYAPTGRRGGAGYGYRNPWPPLTPPVIAPQGAAAEPIEPVALAKPVAKPVAKPAPVDSDQDGVFNPSDLCPDSAAGAPVDAFGCEQNAAIVLLGVNFKTDSAELTGESLAILDSVSTTLVANPDIRVEVAGHTDSDGDDAYNKDLSQRRCESVVAYLAGKGVQAENMTAMGYGEEQPVAGNESAEGKAQNRRVELNRM